ncbi:hypothetical protein AKJ51_01975 [candidate division MSBL1 archaeon SCGC-AAA382A20]|uniref:UspA domain-containing protein n=1 Tax=candidate division MSBL1 archaeon SCGC-AAA382A20 TaxID=1698280 RepID=A0A133VL21_9EURY|nr:hypothetical protein AKJ51_01975 [candidate division MSBL1 archaeon SCGC-AAA382A20]
MLEKVLAPIDSIKWDNTKTAVESVMKIGRSYRVNGSPELNFLHVFHAKPKIPMAERDRITDLKKREIKEDFETIKEMCKENGLENVRTVTRTGKPAKEIVKYAEEKNVDVIVMGSGKLHDRTTTGKIHKFFYGSVTERVIHEAPCSILVAKPGLKFEKILAPIDSIEWDNTVNAVDHAINIAKGCGGRPKLVFMHIMKSASGNTSDIKTERRKMEKKRLDDEFYTIENWCKKKGINHIETILKEGDPDKKRGVDEEIVETAEKQKADLIVMGSGKLHDRTTKGKIEKFFYGSITEKVLHETPCSVLVARPLE